MPDTQKRLCLQIMPTVFPAEPGFYKANETGNICTIIRNIHVSGIQNTVGWFNLCLCVAGGVDDGARRLYSQATIGPIGGLDLSCFIVMNPGDWLGGVGSATNQMSICISGIVVT